MDMGIHRLQVRVAMLPIVVEHGGELLRFFINVRYHILTHIGNMDGTRHVVHDTQARHFENGDIIPHRKGLAVFFLLPLRRIPAKITLLS